MAIIRRESSSVIPSNAVPSASLSSSPGLARLKLLATCAILINGCASVHTVGPVWQGGTQGEAELLASCYRASLALAQAHGVRKIAFPAISCGVYGYPLEQAVRIAVRECAQFAAAEPGIEQIVFACFGPQMLALYRAELAQPSP